MSEKPELPPCAHCGGEAEAAWMLEYPCGHYVSCQACHIQTRPYEKLADAIAAWSRRV